MGEEGELHACCLFVSVTQSGKRAVKLPKQNATTEHLCSSWASAGRVSNALLADTAAPVLLCLLFCFFSKTLLMSVVSTLVVCVVEPLLLLEGMKGSCSL